jgi:hypothetical protein
MVLTVAIALPWIAAMVFAVAKRPVTRFGRLIKAYGLIAIAAVPAIMVQDVMLLCDMMKGYSFKWFDLVSPFVVSWQSWCLIGGYAVSRPFDLWVKDLTGHRQTTMVDNWWVYYIATIVWATPWALLLSHRLAKSPAWRNDRVIRLVLVIVLANALGSVTFSWWGS